MKREVLFTFGSNQRCTLTEYNSGAFDIQFDWGKIDHKSQLENTRNILKQRNIVLGELIFVHPDTIIYMARKEKKPLWRKWYDSVLRKPIRLLAREYVISTDSKNDVAR